MDATRVGFTVDCVCYFLYLSCFLIDGKARYLFILTAVLRPLGVSVMLNVLLRNQAPSDIILLIINAVEGHLVASATCIRSMVSIPRYLSKLISGRWDGCSTEVPEQ